MTSLEATLVASPLLSTYFFARPSPKCHWVENHCPLPLELICVSVSFVGWFSSCSFYVSLSNLKCAFFLHVPSELSSLSSLV